MWKDQRGATAVEWGLITALIAVAFLGALEGCRSSWAQPEANFSEPVLIDDADYVPVSDLS